MLGIHDTEPLLCRQAQQLNVPRNFSGVLRPVSEYLNYYLWTIHLALLIEVSKQTSFGGYLNVINYCHTPGLINLEWVWPRSDGLFQQRVTKTDLKYPIDKFLFRLVTFTA